MQKVNGAALLLTLGHNSSAIFTCANEKPIGYEEERLNKQKSSSAFPRLSIEMIENYVGEKLNGATVFISHWFDAFDEREFSAKYYDHEFMAKLIEEYNLKVVTLSQAFTHHDAHAYSAKAFYNNFSTLEIPKHYLVIDGFGNNQEVVSIYEDVDSTKIRKIFTLAGYENSLGLMYQYATSYTGMKENQDEYKFLGYESHIEEQFSSSQIAKIDKHVERFVKAFGFKLAQTRMHFNQHDDLINYDGLKVAKIRNYAMFDAVISDLKKNDLDTFQKRVAIGYFIQNCIEKAVGLIIDKFEIKNVCLAGGCFYNVKLNNYILRKIKGSICVTPLAGDQGAAIGMYQHYFGNFNYADLCFGKRELKQQTVSDHRIFFFDTEDSFVDFVSRKVNQGYIVNAVSNEMEFGPRALCNTSTLALATQENVEYINMLNDRNTVMPMAPVMLEENANLLFAKKQDLSRVVGSNHYMIITHDYDESMVTENVLGAAHPYPFGRGYSGRPQIVVDTKKPIYKILKNMLNPGTVINTSFNTHGSPILYNVDDCINDFIKQRKNDVKDLTYLAILKND